MIHAEQPKNNCLSRFKQVFSNIYLALETELLGKQMDLTEKTCLDFRKKMYRN